MRGLDGLSYSSSALRIAAALLIAANAAIHSTARGAENGAGSGDAYPSKPVRFISPFSAGGGTDVVARVLAQRMSEAIGRPFVVDNRGGRRRCHWNGPWSEIAARRLHLTRCEPWYHLPDTQPAQGTLRATEGFCPDHANDCIFDGPRRAPERCCAHGQRTRRLGESKARAAQLRCQLEWHGAADGNAEADGWHRSQPCAL